MRMGILTDGRGWQLRWPNAGPVRSAMPYALTPDDADRWISLFEWLGDYALASEPDKEPSRPAIGQHFGPTAPTYGRDTAALKVPCDQHAATSTIRVKRHPWENLPAAAPGEIAMSNAQLDDLFVRDTYLSTVIGMVVQASFGGDIGRLTEDDPADLLLGRDLPGKTGLQVESRQAGLRRPAGVNGPRPSAGTRDRPRRAAAGVRRDPRRAARDR